MSNRTPLVFHVLTDTKGVRSPVNLAGCGATLRIKSDDVEITKSTLTGGLEIEPVSGAVVWTPTANESRSLPSRGFVSWRLEILWPTGDIRPAEGRYVPALGGVIEVVESAPVTAVEIILPIVRAAARNVGPTSERPHLDADDRLAFFDLTLDSWIRWTGAEWLNLTTALTPVGTTPATGGGSTTPTDGGSTGGGSTTPAEGSTGGGSTTPAEGSTGGDTGETPSTGGGDTGGGSTTPVEVPSTPTLSRNLQLSGLNLAGLEYGDADMNDHDVARGYSLPTASHVDYVAGFGFNTIRVPFRWERMQPDGNGTALHAGYLANLKSVVDYATGKGMTVILDCHNYARRRFAADGWASEYYFGTDQLPASAFASLWGSLAAVFKGNDKVIAGLMNEPTSGLNDSQASVDTLVSFYNAAISSIRAAGFGGTILAGGMGYSQGLGWVYYGSNQLFTKLVDPLNRVAFEFHQYVDTDMSGTQDTLISGAFGGGSLRGLTLGARKSGVKLFLGEFNATYATYTSRENVNKGRNAIRSMLDELAANPDVWLGFAGWRTGPGMDGNDLTNLNAWSGGFTPTDNGVTPVSDGSPRDKAAIMADFVGPLKFQRPGAVLDVHFGRGQVFGGTVSSIVALTRGKEGDALDFDGMTHTFAAGAKRLTNRGLRVDPAIVDDNIIPSRDVRDAVWSKGGNTVVDSYVDTDGKTYARVTFDGIYTNNLILGGRTTGKAGSFSAEFKSIGSPSINNGSVYVNFYGGADNDINIDNSQDLRGAPKGEWFRRSFPVYADRDFYAILNARGSEASFLIRNLKFNEGDATPYVTATTDGDALEITGELLTALQSDCTVLIQARDLPTSAVVANLLSATVGGTEVSLLRREADGSVSTAGGAQTATFDRGFGRFEVSYDSRVYGLSRKGSAVIVGMSGVAAVAGTGPTGSLTAAKLGALGSAIMSGVIERITILPPLASAAEMDSLTA